MALLLTQRLPDPVALAREFPVNGKHDVQRHRRAIANVIDAHDPRLMMIIGPCSAWPSEAVKEYADRMARLQEEVRDRMLIVLRCYLQKPRTTVGWPGPLNAPNPTGPVNIPLGIRQCTKLMHEVGQKLPLADEMLFTHNGDYFDRFLSYVAIGARSAEDQEHRFIASGLDMPVGVKNTTSGGIAEGVNGVMNVQTPHDFAYHMHVAKSTGNPHAHLILRGGGGRTNYDAQSLAHAQKLMADAMITHPSIVIDASHDNSGKKPERQASILREIVAGIRDQREEYATVVGIMAESFLKHGKQSEKGPNFDMDGLSITDGCIGWEETEALVREVAETLPA